jgi:hypothetical protein
MKQITSKQKTSNLRDNISRAKPILYLLAIGLIFFAVLQIHDITSFNQKKWNTIKPAHIQFDTIETDNGVLELKDIYMGSASGTSMEPTFSTGNTWIMQKYDNETELVEGQIISYTDNEGSKVAHRITASYYPEFVIVSGDNNMATEKVYINQINYIMIGVLYT